MQDHHQALSKDNQRSSRQLATLGYWALILGSAFFWYNSPWQSQLLNFLTVAICCLGVIPMLRWLGRQDTTYPLLEVLQLTLVPFYASPLINEHAAVSLYPESTLIEAAWIVVLYQLLCGMGGKLADHSHRDRPQAGWWTSELVSDSNLRLTSYFFTLSTAWLIVSNFYDIIPPDLIGTLRAVFFGVGTISAFVQAYMWGSGKLGHTHRILFIINLVLQVLMQSLGLLLISGLIITLLSFVGYFTAARRIPWIAVALALIVFALLQAGKTQMRDIYWNNADRAVSMRSIPAYFQEWLTYGWESNMGDRYAGNKSQQNSLLERASLLQIVSLATELVPDRVAPLHGASYILIPPQVLPRFLWPDKPSPNESVKIMSVHLGILTEKEAETTSIAFGLITESYVNYGYGGISGLALLMGFILRKTGRATAFCNTISVGGIFRILCLAWCLNTETTMALWLSSFYQACVAIIMPLAAYRIFSRR